MRRGITPLSVRAPIMGLMDEHNHGPDHDEERARREARAARYARVARWEAERKACEVCAVLIALRTDKRMHRCGGGLVALNDAEWDHLRARHPAYASHLAQRLSEHRT